jgi:predicted nucleotidyltransferase
MTEENMQQTQADNFIKEFIEWAAAQSDIQAAAMVGSYARHTANEESDLDLVILCEQPEQYLTYQIWLHNFGVILGRQVEEYGKVTSLRVWFEDNVEIEFGFTTPDWAALPVDEGTRRVVTEGMQVLFERSTLLSSLQKEVTGQQ